MSDHKNPFQLFQGTPATVQALSPADLRKKIEELIHSSDVFLFMKGNPEAPRCGFSANTTGILNNLGVKFKTFDILSDPQIRDGVKEYSQWPTYPQLYVKGELVGGNDIVTELYESGELEKIVKA